MLAAATTMRRKSLIDEQKDATMSDNTSKSTSDLKREAERALLIAISVQATALQDRVATTPLLELSQAYANVMENKAPNATSGTGTGPAIA